jgi:hypothetical protein
MRGLPVLHHPCAGGPCKHCTTAAAMAVHLWGEGGATGLVGGAEEWHAWPCGWEGNNDNRQCTSAARHAACGLKGIKGMTRAHNLLPHTLSTLTLARNGGATA